MHNDFNYLKALNKCESNRVLLKHMPASLASLPLSTLW